MYDVLQYMRENENKVYIDVNEMADTLQRRYRDYRAKKRGAFRAMVRKAYDELTEIFSRKPPIRDCPAYDDDYDDEVDVEVNQLYFIADVTSHKRCLQKAYLILVRHTSGCDRQFAPRHV